MRASDEIDNEKVEKEKELRDVEELAGRLQLDMDKLDEEMLLKRLDKIRLKARIDDLGTQARKLKSTIRILTSEFWSSRRDEGR